MDAMPTAPSSSAPPMMFMQASIPSENSHSIKRKGMAPFGQPAIRPRVLDVSSKGNISATFQVPGLIRIPSDGIVHNVTIAELNLDAKMSWVCVPKKDIKTHLKVSFF
jgi:hypothetical protein